MPDYEVLRRKFRDVRERFGYVGRALKLIHEASGRWTIGWALLLLIQGILPAAVVYLTKYVVDAFTAAIGGGLAWESIQPLLPPTALMGAVLLIQQVLGRPETSRHA